MARPLACRSEANGVKWPWNCLAELTTGLVSAPRPSIAVALDDRAAVRNKGFPQFASHGRFLLAWALISSDHGPSRHLLLRGYELSKVKHRSGSAKGTRAMVSGGSSSITIIRPAPQMGQTWVGVTGDSRSGGELESSRSESVVGMAPNNSRHRMSFSRR